MTCFYARKVIRRITAMGSNLLIVRSGGERMGGVRKQPGESLALKDAEEILLKIDEAEAVSPVASGRAQVKYLVVVQIRRIVF